MKHLAALAMSAVAAIAPAARAEPWFPFTIPVLGDRAPAFDLRGLNERVAGERGWLRAEGERIVDAEGREFRLFGTNLTAAACFPDAATAGPLARHLASFGCNVVRLHFLDNQWGPGVPSLLPRSNNPGADGLDREGLARLDRFLAELKAAGVRVNLNLHVGRSYPGATDELPGMGKGTGLFMPREIEELKTYARLLLGHVNPHTGLALKDDPAIPILELSNEDSLVHDPWWTSRLPQPWAGELQRQWNAWLASHHRGLASLREAWGLYTGVSGPECAPPLRDWTNERHDGAESTVAPAPTGNSVRWHATRPGTAAWHLQLASGKVLLEPGKCYRVAFRGRSESGSRVTLSATQAGGEWANLGLGEECALAGEWREFSWRLFPSRVDPAAGSRFVFSLGNRPGVVEVADFSCRAESPGQLLPGEDPAAGSVPVPTAGAGERVRRDYLAFLADVELAFGRGMRGFLREELGCRALVADSQVLFGGVLGARREARVSDFVDNHGYWQHPHWPNRQWDPRDWAIGNTSQLADADGGTLAELALYRPAGKPYTVSEYDLPAPSDHAAEMWPAFAAMASFQGWAGVYHYTFAHQPEELAADRITGYFNAAAHPAKDGLRPAGALVYRLGLVSPARQRAAVRAGDRDLLEMATRINGQLWATWRPLWHEAAGAGGATAFRHATAIELTGGSAGVAAAGPGGLPAAGAPVTSDTGEWAWDPGAGTWTLAAPAARAWCGRIGGRAWPAGDTTCKVAALGDPAPVATVVLVALDGRPVAESAKLLLTALRRAENRDMGWAADRRSVADRWGEGPVRVLGLEAELAMPAGTRWTVTPLDPAGQRRAPLQQAAATVRIEPAHATIWWLLER